MREIKFRAWNKARNVMVDLQKITPFALDASIMNMDGVFIPFHSDLVLMQYTGLKDKNGKEIYEGDLVDSGGTNQLPLTIIFYAPSFMMKRSHGQHHFIHDFVEVIGNIYENPT